MDALIKSTYTGRRLSGCQSIPDWISWKSDCNKLGLNCKTTSSARNFCNSAVSGAVSVANTASGIAKTIAVQAEKDLTDAANEAKDDAISNFTKAVAEAEAAATEATRKFTELGDGIQCALPLQPKGS